MREPLVVITGAPQWAEAAEAQIRDGGFDCVRYPEREHYISRLADDNAALILVDGDRDDWQVWVTSPKVHNATRRIPLVFVSADVTRHDEALLSGANVALIPDDLQAQLPDILTNYARVMDAETQAQLVDECAQPLPPLALQGVEKFNAGEYYSQHDLFEAQWVETEGPVRDLYRAILQVGVAYYQITRNNHRGALKMLLRSQQWLAILPDVCQGVDVRQLRADAARVRTALEHTAPGDVATFDRSLLKPVRFVEDTSQLQE
ncbi:MAG: DUF309 domain-containing protein [Chloroflexi bacterium]|nr:MAG: DUF309 domain-containing protein [Chloroflexota bacterium]